MSHETGPEESAIPIEGEETGESQLTRALMAELVRFRKKRKIGQEPIAKAIGVTQGRISQMENLRSGNLTLEAVLLYAQTIGAEIMVAPARERKKG